MNSYFESRGCAHETSQKVAAFFIYPANGTFRPNSWLTEAQFAAILSRYYAVFKQDSLNYADMDHKVWSDGIGQETFKF